jgi:hypothetical protein
VEARLQLVEARLQLVEAGLRVRLLKAHQLLRVFPSGSLGRLPCGFLTPSGAHTFEATSTKRRPAACHNRSKQSEGQQSGFVESGRVL